MKKNLLIFSTIFLLILSGCSSEPFDCSTYEDKYTEYVWDEELEECVVSNYIQKNFCGNGIAEEDNNEDACTCPEDVKLDDPKLGCSGFRGDYLEYQCSEKEVCELKITDKVETRTELLNLRQGGDFSIDATVKYNSPMIIDRHTIQTNLLLKDKQDSNELKVKNIKIIKAYLVTSGNELLGTIDLNQNLDQKFESIDFDQPIDSLKFNTFDKEMRNVMLKLLITYTKETYTKQNDGTYTLYKSTNEDAELQGVFESRLKLIDPDNKDEEQSSSSAWG